jgi:soluble lytic murein transglycosylase-like protein
MLDIPEDALCPQYWQMAVDVGWKVQDLPMIDRIIKRESGCGPEAHNKQDPMSGSRGLMQINGSWHNWLKDRGIIEKPEDLFISEVNLRAGLAVYNYSLTRQPSCGWYPWRMC